MVRHAHILGFALIVVGALALTSWLIPPLRGLWPVLRQLPWPIQLGAIAASAGVLLLFLSVLGERVSDSANDSDLTDD